ncbi:MAG TPA: hypothetical protein VFS59_01790, partial [Gemmatimonadaceae bacterium]|nr:hypothetical protein [Gemmatimonadaceae bacterium]
SLAWVRPRRGVVAPIAAVDDRPASAAESAPTDIPIVRKEPSRAPRLVGALLALLVLAGLAYWGMGVLSRRRAVQRAAADSAAAVAAARVRVTDSIARIRRDSIARDSIARFGADSFPVYSPANPRDSAAAVGYSILLSKYNTKSGAILDLFGRFARLPASTYGMETPSRFYLLLAGAFSSRTAAESLLVRLRVQGTLARDFGSVDRYPLAFLVDSAVAPRDAPGRLNRYHARGLPVYGLRQPNGVVRLYFGAYATPEQASLAVPQVREAGIRPLLMYRTGRAF